MAQDFPASSSAGVTRPGAALAPLEYSSDESIQYRAGSVSADDRSSAATSSGGGLGSARGARSGPDWILPGEELHVTENSVGYLYAIGKTIGTLHVTNYRLYFESKDVRDTKTQLVLSVPLGFISKVEKIGHSNVSRGEDAYGLEIACKDFRNLRFSSKQEGHSRRPVFEKLQMYSFPLTHSLPFFSFSYKENFDYNGWHSYDPVREFSRMKIPNEHWTLTKINSDYQFSETYPAVLCVPKHAKEEMLRAVGSFRSKARIPVLSWIHPESQASMTRCAQPLVGMTARSSAEDEAYLELIVEANAQSPKLYIMDARPELNAKVNKAKGGGYESDSYFSVAEVVFLDIANIHVVRDSLRKLKDICYPRIDEKNWFTALEETSWLHHLKLVLYGAVRIVDKIENQKTSVLVHCSDGWDRTAQLTSLSMIMLDSYYRTIRGFQVLVEKEWCSMGHKFAHRIGQGEDKHSDSERSPVFLQFLDAVYQLIRQFPIAFEFNQRFLVALMDEVFANRCGNFLHNTEQQRVQHKVKELTKSVWSVLSVDQEKYTNPLYNTKTGSQVLIPNCSLRCLKLWKEYYLRHNVFVAPSNQEEEELIIRQLLAVKKALQEECSNLVQQQNQAAQRSAELSGVATAASGQPVGSPTGAVPAQTLV